MGTSVSDWSQDDVASFLGDIGLGHLAPKFKDNGVNGKDLLELEDDDYRESLGCSNLQVRLSNSFCSYPCVEYRTVLILLFSIS